jgi:hypothetical protein
LSFLDFVVLLSVSQLSSAEPSRMKALGYSDSLADAKKRLGLPHIEQEPVLKVQTLFRHCIPVKLGFVR